MSASSSRKDSLTDWTRLADPADDDIDYSDIPPLDDAFFEEAAWAPPVQETVTVRLDRDLLVWLKEKGEFQHLINSILRAYKEAHKSAA